MKLTSFKNRKQLGEHMITHLASFDRSDINTMIGFVLVAWLDIYCMTRILNLPWSAIFDLPFFILLIGMNGWAVRMLVKSRYSIQIESLYFIGGLSLLAMVGCMILVTEFIYSRFPVSLPLAFLFTFLYFLCWIIYFGQYTIRKYAEKHFNPGKKLFLFGLLVIAIALYPGTGYNNMSRVVIGHPWESQLLLIFDAGISIFFIYIAVLHLHKLLYIQLNRDLFSYTHPTAKNKKKMKAQGKKLIIK